MPASNVSTAHPATAPLSVAWIGDANGQLRLIDQTRLPGELEYLDCRSTEQVWVSIERLKVRGAPAIGIAAAYGVLLEFAGDYPRESAEFLERTLQACDYLASSRPTAVNLFWALNRMRGVAKKLAAMDDFDGEIALEKLLKEARAIHDEDRAMCRAIGMHGSALLSECQGVLTHCNTGGLATSEYGTALSAFFTSQDMGHTLHIYADETRPLLQGARLTTWELMQRKIPVTLICDSMAAQVMREGKVQAVMVGADRIAANGDAANKIGTYMLAVLAKHHNIPFYVAAPSSTFDVSITDGSKIPIEQRADYEITEGFGRRTAPDDVTVYNPAFDVTPAELITAIVTERGLINPVSRNTVLEHLGVV
jgi:methylthioribose-1-phosphate isomerase